MKQASNVHLKTFGPSWHSYQDDRLFNSRLEPTLGFASRGSAAGSLTGPEGVVQILRGRAETGQGDASRWLGMFNDAYARKVGTPVFPGSLNVRLAEPFDRYAPEVSSAVIRFAQGEYGGERDVLMMRCSLRGLDNQDAHLWSTVNAARDPTRRMVIEVIASVNLRETYGLADGDDIEIELVEAS